jgi:hypothetical protein
MNAERLENGIQELKLNQTENECDADSQSQLQFTTFTELVNDVSLHYQIIRFPKQVFPFPNPSFLQFDHSEISV